MSRHARKIDKSQPQIVADLRKAGVQVVILSANGRDVPDLLLGAMGRWVLCELKSVKGETRSGDFSRGQMEFIANAKAPVGVATNFEEALLLATCGEKVISEVGKLKLAQWLLVNKQQSLRISKFREIVE